MNETLARRHEFVAARNPEILEEILAADVKFHPPFVSEPRDGKATTVKILKTVTTVFEDFRCVREIVGAENCALEFEAEVGDSTSRAVDLVRIDAGKIVDFEVTARPANAPRALGMEMDERLSRV